MSKYKKNRSKQPQTKKGSNHSDFQNVLKNFESEILNFYEKNQGLYYRPQDIHDVFDLSDKKIKYLFTEIIHDLFDQGLLIKNTDGSFAAIKTESNEPSFTGKLEHVSKQHGFVVVEGEEEDIFVDARNFRSAIDGDIVTVQLVSSRNRRDDRQSKAGKRREGRVTTIVTRAHPQLVGTVELWTKHAMIEPDNRRIYDPVYVPAHLLNGATNHDKVVVKINQWSNGSKSAEGEIVEILGQAGENNAEMHAILAEFKLPYRFPEEVEKESEAIKETLTKEDFKGRRDFRGITTFTIDPADAKDFDDAISFQTLANGNYEIGVHIADVSHYVKPGTELEKEAVRRATSVYLVDRTVPMLPEKLSNNLCSLKPHEDRLAFSAVFEVTPRGKVVSQWFGRTIIYSNRRFSYEEAQEIIETKIGDYAEELIELNRIAKIMRTTRFKKGAINFETAEIKFKLDENGKPLGVVQKIRKDAHKLIEEYMLLANRQVAEFVYGLTKGKNKNTMVYRVHESPDPEKLRTFSAFVKRLGYDLKLEGEKHIADSMNKMLGTAEGKPEQNLLEQLAVRTMAKARYTTEDLGHFGLAFRRYSHFTSPIRRYPDVMAHRLLQHYLDGGQSVDKEEYESYCKHSSERERLATEAERASIKYKQAEYMSYQEKDLEYQGIISGVTEFGIFVEISETASEGLIRMTDLNDDYYELDKENYRLVGQRTKKFYTFGDIIKVKVKEVNLGRRSIDLIPADFEKQISNRPKTVHKIKGTEKKDTGRSRRRRKAE